MKSIDLHGIKHNEVEKVVTDAACVYEIPFRIITGHSKRMKRLVREALSHFNLEAKESISNDGCLIVFKNGKKK